MATVVVLGGGISGLATTYYLSTLGKEAIKKVLLIERSGRLGGWIRSTALPDGTVYEHGPSSLNAGGDAGRNSLQLVQDLGLSEYVLAVPRSSRAGQEQLVLSKGRLTPLPGSFKELLWPGHIFRTPLLLPLLKDLWLAGRPSIGSDESVYDFSRKRFNKEVADYIMDPLTRTLCGGCSKEISFRSLLPKAFQAALTHGSVLKGKMEQNWKDKQEFNMLKLEAGGAESLLARSADWSTWSLRRGLQQLCDTLAEKLDAAPNVHVFVNEANVSLKPSSDGQILLSFAELAMPVDYIFSCIPARKLSQLLIHDWPELAQSLLSIPSVHLAIVNLEFKGQVLSHELSGFMVPSSEVPHLLNVNFDSCCFPEHDGQYDTKTRITVMMGGRWFKQTFGEVDSADPDAILEAAKEAARKYLQIEEPPVRHHVNILKECIPQYLVGHLERMSNMCETITSSKLPLTLLGASYRGPGANECIYHAKQAVEGYLETLQA
ncbi:protoporphyrinogen oxidase [Amblyomma americanum]